MIIKYNNAYIDSDVVKLYINDTVLETTIIGVELNLWLNVWNIIYFDDNTA